MPVDDFRRRNRLAHTHNRLRKRPSRSYATYPSNDFDSKRKPLSVPLRDVKSMLATDPPSLGRGEMALCLLFGFIGVAGVVGAGAAGSEAMGKEKFDFFVS